MSEAHVEKVMWVCVPVQNAWEYFKTEILTSEYRKGSYDFFLDQDGILLSYLPKGQTINAEYYSSLLVQLKDILKEKRRGKITKGGLVLARQCLGSPGTCNSEETGLPGLPVSWSLTLSADLAPSDYHLFPELKKQLKGRRFSSDVEVIAVAVTWLDGQISDFFLSGLQKSEQRAKKCIELHGAYVE